MSERGDRGRGRRGQFNGGRFDRGGRDEPRRNSTRSGTERYDPEGRDAMRRAAQNRPEGGYTLDDFDDIPMPRRGSSAASETPKDEGRAVDELDTADEPGAADLSHAKDRTEDVDGSMRLQKALANAGVASRRVCEQYIVAGRVSVNGAVVTELGSRVHPEHDRIEVDGTPVQLDQSMRYIVLNKPAGVVSTMRDEQGRPDLRQFAREYGQRVYNVGRLDGETSGLLLLTNDGDLANVLAHPSYGITKTYVAKVRGRVTPQTVQRLLDGFELEDGFIKADRATIHADQPSQTATLVELTLHSGRNRIVRRMLDHVGHPVIDLVRRSFGPLHLGTLRAGETRELSSLEQGRLLKLARRAERHVESPHANRAQDVGSERGDDGDAGGSRAASQRTGSAGDRPARGDRRPAPRDRQPRKEWSGRDRAERRDRTARGSRPTRDERDRGGRSADRRDRPDRRDRDDRPRRDDRPGRGDRPYRSDRPSRDERPGRDDRPYRSDRPSRDDRPRRDDRPGRSDRPRYDDRRGRDDRLGRLDRPRRDDRPYRSDRPSRDDRPGRDDRSRRDERPTRDERPRRDSDRGRYDRGQNDRGGYDRGGYDRGPRGGSRGSGGRPNGPRGSGRR